MCLICIVFLTPIGIIDIGCVVKLHVLFGIYIQAPCPDLRTNVHLIIRCLNQYIWLSSLQHTLIYFAVKTVNQGWKRRGSTMVRIFVSQVAGPSRFVSGWSTCFEKGGLFYCCYGLVQPMLPMGLTKDMLILHSKNQFPQMLTFY